MAFITFTGGSVTFAVFLLVVLVALVFSTYTRRGSAINQRSYGNVHGDAPGAFAASDLAHDRDAARRLTRGTR